MGRDCVPVCGGIDPRNAVCVCEDSYEVNLLKYSVFPDLRNGVYPDVPCGTWTACGDDHDRKYHAADPRSSHDKLLPRLYQRGHDQRTFALLRGDDHGSLCGGRIYLFKNALGSFLYTLKSKRN